jgi:Arc/MetJ-type ribon-helix-helix transcriptional regulator
MSHIIPTHIQHRLETLMASGEFENENAILEQAIDALAWRQKEEEKLRRWAEQNRRAVDESRMGQSKPIDLEAVLNRVETRVANDGQE